MGDGDIIVGITGASGALYGRAFVREMLAGGLTVHLIPTRHAALIWRSEIGPPPGAAGRGEGEDFAADWKRWLGGAGSGGAAGLVVYDDADIGAAPASGSFRARAMVIVPCSMNTLAKVANGISDTLLARAAAVALKERRPLVLVPRETPLGLADLRNMVAATEAGAVVLPASPGFYDHPREIGDLVNFIVSKICDQIGLASGAPIRYEGGGRP